MQPAERLLRMWLAADVIEDPAVRELLAIHLADLEWERSIEVVVGQIAEER